MIKRVYAWHAQEVGGDGNEAWGRTRRRSWFPHADLAYDETKQHVRNCYGKNMAIRHFARIQ